MEGQVQDAQRSSEKLVSTARQARKMYFWTLLECTLNATAASSGTTYSKASFSCRKAVFHTITGKPATFLPTPQNLKTGFLPSLTAQNRSTQLPLCQSCPCLTLGFSKASLQNLPDSALMPSLIRWKEANTHSLPCCLLPTLHLCEPDVDLCRTIPVTMPNAWGRIWGATRI